MAGIGPGLVETPLTEYARLLPQIGAAYLESIPLGRVGAPSDVADAALFLVSSEASWVSGETLYVVANLRIPTPGFLAGVVGNPSVFALSPAGELTTVASARGKR